MKTRSGDAVLTFTDVSLTLKDKTILTNINGKAKSGQLLAIMGPTGKIKKLLKFHVYYTPAMKLLWWYIVLPCRRNG
jgi:Fe-S cluster assembly ATPase SufC